MLPKGGLNPVSSGILRGKYFSSPFSVSDNVVSTSLMDIESFSATGGSYLRHAQMAFWDRTSLNFWYHPKRPPISLWRVAVKLKLSYQKPSFHLDVICTRPSFIIKKTWRRSRSKLKGERTRKKTQPQLPTVSCISANKAARGQLYRNYVFHFTGQGYLRAARALYRSPHHKRQLQGEKNILDECFRLLQEQWRC